MLCTYVCMYVRSLTIAFSRERIVKVTLTFTMRFESQREYCSRRSSCFLLTIVSIHVYHHEDIIPRRALRIGIQIYTSCFPTKEGRVGGPKQGRSCVVLATYRHRPSSKFCSIALCKPLSSKKEDRRWSIDRRLKSCVEILLA